MLKKLIAVAGVSAAVFALAPTAHAATNTVVVNGDGQAGWAINRDPANTTPYEFNDEAASTGSGSLDVAPIGNTVNGNADKFVAEKTLEIPASDLQSVQYDFQAQVDGKTAQQAANQTYLNVYVLLADRGTSWFDCRYDFIADSASTAGFVTAGFDVTDTPDSMDFRNEACTATIAELPEGATIWFFSLNLGDTSGNDAGIGAYFDNVVVATSAETTAYDFEPVVTAPTSKDDCKKGGWQSFDDPAFRNQGECVSFVATNGGNPPAAHGATGTSR